MKWLLFALCLVLGCNSCARNTVAPFPGVSYDKLLRVDGFTFCRDGRLHSFVSGELSLVEMFDTYIHEATHRGQKTARNIETCGAWLDYVNTPTGYWATELEAYAKGMCFSVRNGKSREFLVNDYAHRMVLTRGPAQIGTLTDTTEALDSARAGLRRYPCRP